VVGLDDLPLGTKAAMNGYTWGTGSRYGDFKIIQPQADDINGANAIYR